MYATVTEITCKTAVDLEQAVGKLDVLHAEVRHLPGFTALYVIRTAEQVMVMVTLYASEEEADAVSAQVRTHLGNVIGPHVSGPPRRAAGNVVLPR